MGARADRIPHRVCARVAGVSLVWPRIVFRPIWSLRSKDDQPRARARGRRPDRRGYLAAASQRQVVCGAHRARFAEHRHRARSVPTRSRWLPRSCWAARTHRCGTLALERSAGRQFWPFAAASSPFKNWNPALPQLELRDVDLDLRRGADVAALAVDRAVAGGARRHVELQRDGARCAADWRRWIGTSLASARDMSFPGWRELLPEYLTRLDAGTGGFEVRRSGEGSTLARADLDFDAQGVMTKLADGPSAQVRADQRRLDADPRGRSLDAARPPRARAQRADDAIRIRSST